MTVKENPPAGETADGLEACGELKLPTCTSSPGRTPPPNPFDQFGAIQRSMRIGVEAFLRERGDIPHGQ